jgi:DNA invertase Pin-like site-specific DNA recombinase
MIYGYARVSTDGESVDAQIRQLRNVGAGKVFREVASELRPTGRSFAGFSPKSPPPTC